MVEFKILKEMNAPQVIEKIENGDWEVEYDYFDLEILDGHYYVRHSINVNDEVSEYEVEFPEHEDIQELREEIYEAEDLGDSFERIDELKAILNDRLSGVEHNDVYDYEAVPSVLHKGFYI